MTAYSLKYAKDHLERIAEETVENSAETIITLDSGQAVVMIPLEQYESWKETQFLLSNPANRAHLLESAQQYRAGQATRRTLIDPERTSP
ncbi:type II toxin-antitoxin system Phd/YefM family antitoxin [Deinococcus xianganensis]|uniref:Antitoxin n=1 Tax=Deinococcus xianganensis TaxID=1507289 RepID=A0A6I4YLD2_9DEIO|nr:type II toxin-antitoxin system Phd/YefM family antitoxin [Deinococcus xianganensis]MXV20811.1 hypothetical protein [Deinococcus xianganensis]